jgi:exopolyphosphatase/guanosine-5'-triphosphate,3'-diphosphate pyrophosphatase
VTIAGGAGVGRGAPARSAVVDVGSNSVLLLAVDVDSAGVARAVDEAVVTTRLGSGLRPGGALDPAAASRTCRAVVELCARARAGGADAAWAFATGAARRAADGADFAAATAREAGLPVEILSGDEEARLAHAAAVHGLGLDDTARLVVDVGGATTELTLGRGTAIDASVSLPMGALALTEETGGDLERVRAHVARVLATTALPARAAALGATVVASGGTATSLAALALGLERYDPRRVHGAILTAGGARAAVGACARSGAIDAGRAAILPAGACILDGVMAAAAAREMRVSDHGVRHAYLRERLAAHGVVADMRALWG